MNAEVATGLMTELTRLIENEHRATCQVLEAVAVGNRDYKPDPKSRSAWELAKHLATTDVFMLDSVIKGAFEYDAEKAGAQEAKLTTVPELMAFYQAGMTRTLKEIRSLPPDKLTRVIDFFGVMQMPAASFLGFVNNHSIHHRGQLAGYLRAMGSKVPSIYGPSADAETR